MLEFFCFFLLFLYIYWCSGYRINRVLLCLVIAAPPSSSTTLIHQFAPPLAMEKAIVHLEARLRKSVPRNEWRRILQQIQDWVATTCDTLSIEQEFACFGEPAVFRPIPLARSPWLTGL